MIGYRAAGGSVALVLGPILLAGEAAAQCTVPNALTNGQMADASQVMDNFNAVAACVEDAAEASVTHDGTPQTGAIAVFTGADSITSGDLTGDVSTSGGTATTLAPSGVTAGNYVNPNITIDAKGRITAAASGSGGTGGGILSARVSLAGTQALTASTYATVQFDTVEFEGLTGLWEGSPTYGFVIPNGVNRAEILASSGTTSADLGGYWHLQIRKNGTSFVDNAVDGDFYGVGLVSTGVIQVDEGDEFTFVIRPSGSKSIGTTTLDPFMSIKLLAE